MLNSSGSAHRTHAPARHGERWISVFVARLGGGSGFTRQRQKRQRTVQPAL